jgi:hypothetical protein
VNLPILAATPLLALLPAPLSADNTHTPAPAFESSHPWITNLDLALEQSRKTSKPILAEFR